MRIAWNVRVAGSLFWPGRKPAARRTMAASSAVRSTGRAATMARAIARARGSPPHSPRAPGVPAPGARLLPIVAQDPGDLGLVGRIEEFGGGHARLAHPHIERAVGLERKATL